MLLRPFKRDLSYTNYGFEFYSIIDWCAIFSPDYQTPYAEKMDKLKKWCEDHQVYYYAAPREHFNLHSAVEYAEAEGYSKVLVEDLS